MTMDRGDVNSWVQTYGGSQLRTFDVTVRFRVNAYVRGTGGNWSYTRGQDYYHRFEYVNANNSIYNNYVDENQYKVLLYFYIWSFAVLELDSHPAHLKVFKVSTTLHS